MDTTVNGIEKIRDYYLLSDRIGTSGQPDKEQFTLIKDAGYQNIINLAAHNSTGALTNEKSIVEALGLAYHHIPVPWDAPSVDQLQQFFTLFESLSSDKVFIHCIANKRVSVFCYLYRVCHQKWDTDLAENDLLRVWTPNSTWQIFINSVVAKSG